MLEVGRHHLGMNDPLRAALEYASLGLPVIALHTIRNGRCTCDSSNCGSPGKHPLTRHGKDDATTDPDQIRRWFTRWPGANIGGRPPLGRVVVDVDPRSGGDDTLNALEREHGDLPRTRTAITGSDGLHLWFRGTATVGKLGAGVDVKTNAGYVVLPPSRHISGRHYLWTDETPPAPAPEWLAGLLTPPPPARPQHPLNPERAGTRPDVAGVLAVVLSAQEGGRNHALHWSACRLWERVAAGRLGDGQAEAMLVDAAHAVGLPDGEALATIRSARRSAGV